MSTTPINPSKFLALAKQLYKTGSGVDARSQYLDVSLTPNVVRDYKDTTEVTDYLANSNPTIQALLRSGGFPILVNVGGTLNGDGTFTGGVRTLYWFQNGQADGDLTLYIPATGGGGSFGALTGVPGDNAALAAVLGNKVDKVMGKGLSTNDYTTIEQTKLASLPTLPALGAYDALEEFCFIGDSQTEGSVGVRTPAETVFDYYQVTADRRGHGGRFLQGPAGPANSDGSNSLEGNLDIIPNKGAHKKKLIIWLSTNDLILGDPAVYTTATYTTSYHNVLDNALSKGWTAADIILVTAGYCDPGPWPYATLVRQQAYRDTTIAIGATYGCTVVNIFDATYNEFTTTGGANLDGGGVHSTNDGYNFIAHLIIPHINYNVEDKGKAFAVNGEVELKRLKLLSNFVPNVDNAAFKYSTVIAADVNGNLYPLPYMDVVRNLGTDPSVVPQQSSININRGRMKRLYLTDTMIMDGFHPGEVSFVKADFSGFADISAVNGKFEAVVSAAQFKSGAGAIYLHGANEWWFTSGGSFCKGVFDSVTTDADITAGTKITTPSIVNNAQQFNVNGSTSGTMTCTQPEKGGSYKKVILYCNGLTGTAEYVFPSTFTNTPVVLNTNGLSAALVTTLTTVSAIVTGSGSTGFIIIEGF